jgi:hypothetical protein
MRRAKNPKQQQQTTANLSLGVIMVYLTGQQAKQTCYNAETQNNEDKAAEPRLSR